MISYNYDKERIGGVIMDKKKKKIIVIIVLVVFLSIIFGIFYYKVDYLKYKYDKQYLIINTRDLNFLNGLTNQLKSSNIFVKKLRNNKDLVIKKDEITKIKFLYLSNKNIEDITGIQYFVNLVTLNLNNNKIKSLESLATLTKLNYLDISHNRIENYSPLSNLVDLKELNLLHNSCNDIMFVQNLTKLESLSYGSLVTYKGNNAWVMSAKMDISPLEKITNLKRLTLSGTIGDTKPFLNLINLEVLKLSCNFENFSNFKNLKNLIYLDLSGSKIYDNNKDGTYASDYSAFESLVNLKELYLTNTNDPTFENSKNDKLLYGIKNMSNLEILDISYRTYVTITAEDNNYFLGLDNLKTLYVDDTGLCSLKPLEKLSNLENIYMRANTCSANLNFNILKSKTNLKNIFITEGDEANLKSQNSKFDQIEINIVPQRTYNMKTPF